MPVSPPPDAETGLVIRIRGVVQGVGFRPYVFKLATELGLKGWVRNDVRGVVLRVLGTEAKLGRFQQRLLADAPPASHIDAIETSPNAEGLPDVGDSFCILQSERREGAISVAIPADLALCEDCRRELAKSEDRRFAYPFINCTQCGPRYSLIEGLPYDRERTSMRHFRMCETCAEEYATPSQRRFHAEPNACPVCGPRVRLNDLSGNQLGGDADVFLECALRLRSGEIVAIKGVGGYHLFCDACSDSAVLLLRSRKRRDEKPFAVMFPDLASLRRSADLNEQETTALRSKEAPIVLLWKRADSELSPLIAPENPWVGALLPYSPLHVLLLQSFGAPLVATSANLSEEPLCIDNDEARSRLAGIADCILEHDRGIIHPVDDSVVRFSRAGHPILLRRARGYAPTSIKLPGNLAETVLCVGAQMKSTVLLAQGDEAVASPHIGDLENAATFDAFKRSIGTLSQLWEAPLTQVVCDKHPNYLSTHYAEFLGLPRLAVQHHLAHLLSCLVDNQCYDDGVLGVVWDGLGHGEDGSVWGGEFIRLQGGKAERFGRLKPFQLLGGDAASHDARRVVFSLGGVTGMQSKSALIDRLGFEASELKILSTMAERRINSPMASSVGRLFDAVACLLSLGLRNNYEGQLALNLEAAASRCGTPGSCELPPFVVRECRDGEARYDMDWGILIDALMHAQGVDRCAIAWEFHHHLAQAALEMARRSGMKTIALSGGCFQNALLLDLCVSALTKEGYRVLTHRRFSPGDGSIAIGQALAALWKLGDVQRPQ